MTIEAHGPSAAEWRALIASYGPSGLIAQRDFRDVAARVSGHQAYLATPYSLMVQGPDGRWDRGLSLDAEMRAARWMRLFARARATVVSPIVLSCAMVHADVEQEIDPLDAAFWTDFCQPMLVASRAVVVPPIRGWQMSRGIWHEVTWALRHAMPVHLVIEGSEFARSTLRGAA